MHSQVLKQVQCYIKAEKFSTKYHQWLGGYKKADEYNKGPGEESQHQKERTAKWMRKSANQLK